MFIFHSNECNYVNSLHVTCLHVIGIHIIVESYFIKVVLKKVLRDSKFFVHILLKIIDLFSIENKPIPSELCQRFRNEGQRELMLRIRNLINFRSTLK